MPSAARLELMCTSGHDFCSSKARRARAGWWKFLTETPARGQLQGSRRLSQACTRTAGLSGGPCPVKARSTHHRCWLQEACREVERPGSVRAAALNLKMERYSWNQPPNSSQSLCLRWEERLDLRPSPGGSGEAES